MLFVAVNAKASEYKDIAPECLKYGLIQHDHQVDISQYVIDIAHKVGKERIDGNEVPLDKLLINYEELLNILQLTFNYVESSRDTISCLLEHIMVNEKWANRSLYRLSTS